MPAQHDELVTHVEIEPGADPFRLRISGHLGAHAVPLLRLMSRRAIALGAQRLEVDLREVSGADVRGVAAVLHVGRLMRATGCSVTVLVAEPLLADLRSTPLGHLLHDEEWRAEATAEPRIPAPRQPG